MGGLTTQGLIDFRKASVTAVPVVTFSFPDNNTRRYSVVGSPLNGSLGIYRDRILDIGDIDYRLSDPQGGLQSVTTTIVLEDADGDFRSIFTRYGQIGLVGSAVLIDAATKSDVADWPHYMTGIVDGLDPIGNNQWIIFVRVDDRAIVDGVFRVPRISAVDYHAALDPNLEKIMPIALGIFDSRDGTVEGSTGSIQLTRLNEDSGTGGFPYRYLLGHPYYTYVSRVAKNGTTLASSAWVRTYTQRYGIATTEIWLASDPVSTDVLTADGIGIGTDQGGSSSYVGSSGTGRPVINIVKQMRLLLNQYVFGAYLIGEPVAEHGSIDSPSWTVAEEWAERQRFRGSFLIKESGQNPIDVFNAFCQWTWLRAGWSREGKLGIYPFFEDLSPYFDGSEWIRRLPTGSEGEFFHHLPTDRTVHNIRSAAWFIPATNTSRSAVSIRDSRITGNVVVDINHNIGVARQEFQDGYPGPAGIIAALNADRMGALGDGIYLTHAADISKWRDINWSPATTAFDFPNSFRTALGMAAPGGNEPQWHGGGVNGHSFVRFNGTDSYMDSTIAHGITAAEFCYYFVFRLLGANAKGGFVYQQDMIIGDALSTYWGVHAYTDGGLYYLEASNFDGTHDSVTQEINLNQWYVGRFRHFGGNIYLSVDNFNEVVAASGDTTTLTGKLRLGVNSVGAGGNKFFNGDLAEVLGFSVGDLAVQGNTSGNTTPALGANFDIYQALADRYGI